MSDIVEPRAPSPFNPTPTAPSARGGCSKPVFVGCGALMVLILCGFLYCAFNAQKLVQKWFALVEEKVTEVAPDDLTPGERGDLHRAFADLSAVFAHGGKSDPKYLQPFQTQLMQIISKPKGQVTRKQILELTRTLELTAGKRPPPGADEIPASPPSTPGSPPAAGEPPAAPQRI